MTDSPPPDGALRLEEAFSNLRFTRPVDLQSPGDGSARLFVVEQAGIIKAFDNHPDIGSADVFLDIRSRVRDQGNEEGLLGLAFHPNFASNGYFYVDYTASNPRRTVIARYRADPNDADRALTDSETVILEVNQPYGNHNGGQIVFGPDGYLYVALGDGGSGGDPHDHGENPATLLGSILRIDVDGDSPYAIPADNPFAGNNEGYREEIYAYGLRNPWRISFDPATGDLWAADVGQNLYEEVNLIEKGGNYGWDVMEGLHCYEPNTGCAQDGLTLPVWEYSHDFGISITGGYVYRGPSAPSLSGRYVFADYGTGRIWALAWDGARAQVEEIMDTSLGISSFGVDAHQELYALAFNGRIYRFTEESDPSVTITESGGGTSVSEHGGTDTYDVVLNSKPTQNVTVTVASGSPGAATVKTQSGTAGATTTLTFTPTTWGAAQTITVTGVNDDVDNANNRRTATITHSSSSMDPNYNALSIPSVTATVTDDDSAPTAIALSVNDNSVDEGDGAQTITVTATVGGSDRFAAAQTVAAAVAGSGGSNVVGFTASPSAFNILIAAGAQTGTGTFTLTPTDNSADEADETIIVSGALSGVTVSSATITLTDDDATAPPPPPPTTPVLTIGGGSAVTEGGAASFTINSIPAPSGSITARYTVTQSGQFVAVSQLGGGKTQSVSSASTTFTIPTVPDNVDEPNGSVTVTLNPGQGYAVGTMNAATVAVHDNDDGTGPPPIIDPPPPPPDKPTVTLSVAPNPVTEGEEITVTVTPSTLTPSAVTIPIILTAGSAEAEDYGALAAVVIEANEPHGRGAIATLKDDDTDDETFTVTFGAVPAEFTRGTPSSVEVIITEDESVTSIESLGDEIPAAFAGKQNYPNPFNPSTAIEYALPAPDYVRLEVFDAQGRSVGVLVDGVRPAGTHSVRFDATGLPSGLYVYWLQAGGETLTRKMTLVR